MIKGSIVCLAASLIASGAYAQDIYYWPAPTANAADSRMLNFPPGTPIAITTRHDISTKDVHPGERVYLSVAENIVYEGQIVLPVGAPVVAEVAQADRNGHFGVKGKLTINLLYVQTPMGPVGLSGSSAKTGHSGTAASIATIALVSPLGFLIHGTSAKIPYGTTVQGYLSQPLRFWGRQQQAVAAPIPNPQDVAPARVAFAH